MTADSSQRQVRIYSCRAVMPAFICLLMMVRVRWRCTVSDSVSTVPVLKRGVFIPDDYIQSDRGVHAGAARSTSSEQRY